MSVFDKPQKPIRLERSELSYAKKPFIRHTKIGVSRIVRDTYGSKEEWYALCKEVADDAGHKCEGCTWPDWDTPKRRFETHHRLPLAKGGTTTKANLMYLCEECHKKRHKHMR